MNSSIRTLEMNATEIVASFIGLAAALNYIHLRRNYMHCDIKADNILVDKHDRQPVLIDFVLAKNLNRSEVEMHVDSPILTSWKLFAKSTTSSPCPNPERTRREPQPNSSAYVPHARPVSVWKAHRTHSADRCTDHPFRTRVRLPCAHILSDHRLGDGRSLDDLSPRRESAKAKPRALRRIRHPRDSRARPSPIANWSFP